MKPIPHRKNNNGFTLLEISIVIVLIGLLVGGVLVGRDLIANAEQRKIVSKLQSLEAAIKTFRLKYNCIPGDCANATVLGLGGSGNGDGRLAAEGMEDTTSFLSHLGAAGLIAINSNSHMPITDKVVLVGAYQNPPGDPTTGILSEDIVLNLNQYDAGNAMMNYALTPLQAKRIDEALDDGLPVSGRIVFSHPTDEFLRYDSTTGPGSTDDGTSCVTDETTPWSYNNLTSSEKLCVLALVINKY